jgi:DNA (cytosine-5)-methyltransferase 1
VARCINRNSTNAHSSLSFAGSVVRLLDLFCGAGGASVGYHRAGFTEIVGVDIKPQPRYPFTFVYGDALEYVAAHGHEFDAIHASPPCQAYSVAAQSQRNIGKEYPDLVGETRARLEATGIPWVIENVPGAPMRSDFVLCGCRVGLALRRVRLFETSWGGFDLIAPCSHTGPVVSVVGLGTPSWVRQQLGYNPTISHYRAAMGIQWMNRNELSQAIPPAYTHYIGTRLIQFCYESRLQSSQELRLQDMPTDTEGVPC